MATLQKIFIGDIQGCADELAVLIDRAQDRFGDEFELWCVGDLVNRGPNNLRVLELVRQLSDLGRAHAVLGNHDLALIAMWLGARDPSPFDTVGDVLESRDVDDWLDWLRRLPLSIAGELSEGQAFAMVHASVHPNWDLRELRTQCLAVEARLASSNRDVTADLLADGAALDRDRDVLGRVTRCRSIARNEEWSSAQPEGSRRAWHRAWASAEHDYGVVYGHWARQGLHVAPGLRGLDTGCVHHGRGRDGVLTAWLPEADAAGGSFALPDRRFWQIPARKAYYAEVRQRSR